MRWNCSIEIDFHAPRSADAAWRTAGSKHFDERVWMTF
jgi:ubiquinone biosynthesis protein COQ9